MSELRSFASKREGLAGRCQAPPAAKVSVCPFASINLSLLVGGESREGQPPVPLMQQQLALLPSAHSSLAPLPWLQVSPQPERCSILTSFGGSCWIFFGFM